MKNFIYGFITCLLLVILCIAIPIAAENLEVTSGGIRINVDGVDCAQWDENILLSDGRSVPYSISYNDTTYLPMRKISELLRKTVYWNGDSNTASITDYAVSSSENEIAKEPDANGNVWVYYTFATSNGRRYLGVKDEARGYERVYRIIGSNKNPEEKDTQCVKVEEDGIYFVRILPRLGHEPYTSSALYKINFNSDENSQDGEDVFPLDGREKSSVMFVGDCLFYTFTNPGSNANMFSLSLVNLKNQSGDTLPLQIASSNSPSGVEYLETEPDGKIYWYYYKKDAAHTYRYRVEAIIGDDTHWGEPELLSTEENSLL